MANLLIPSPYRCRLGLGSALHTWKTAGVQVSRRHGDAARWEDVFSGGLCRVLLVSSQVKNSYNSSGSHCRCSRGFIQLRRT